MRKTDCDEEPQRRHFRLLVWALWVLLLIQRVDGRGTCLEAPRLVPSLLPRRSCRVLSRVCAVQDGIVSHDPGLAFENITRADLPSLPAIGSWSVPFGLSPRPWVHDRSSGEDPSSQQSLALSLLSGAGFGDCKHGVQAPYRLFVRSASALELDPSMDAGSRTLSFSNCTLPVVIAVDWPHLLVSHFATGVIAVAHSLLGTGAIGTQSTLVVVTPGGLRLAPVQQQLLQRLGTRAGLTWGELARLGPPGPVAWSGEGERVQCFEKMVVCGRPPVNASHGAMALGARLGTELAAEAKSSDPAGFGGPRPEPRLGSPGGRPVLRVLLEDRRGPVRRLLNLPALLAACEAANREGFRAGHFKGIACRTHAFDPDDHDTLISPEQLRANIAAVRSAHVLVAVHGEAAAYGIFIQPYADGDAGLSDGSALVELRPCGLGTEFLEETDMLLPGVFMYGGTAAPVHVAWNVEDPAQCSPGALEVTATKLIAGKRRRKRRPGRSVLEMQRRLLEDGETGGWADDGVRRVGPQGYLDGPDALADQHLSLRPQQLMQVLKEVGERVASRSVAEAAARAGRGHVYALPGGRLEWGALGESWGQEDEEGAA
ncbi:hypothetical protein HYH03_001846 [Edaphochlamys debaryana]|uniref:Uncharacterized protein n=1 Tax=Edaphochlamys debaryana TaxID=47281 RepID=A0A835YCP3_9CHLO|nr:hypothetical protein HYH03_001846 [Edaphochlamys debaryana]|eukprot:KAG2500268.1 hypothetical protein HYH03_001846 [Edaphochlamys debaryana]